MNNLVWKSFVMCNILVMKIPNRERCMLVLKLNPFKLGIIAFLQILAPWWFCCKSTPLLVMNLKSFMKVVTKLKILLSLQVFQKIKIKIASWFAIFIRHYLKRSCTWTCISIILANFVGETPYGQIVASLSKPTTTLGCSNL